MIGNNVIQSFYGEETKLLVQEVGVVGDHAQEGSPNSQAIRPSMRMSRLLVIVAASIYGTNFAAIKMVDNIIPFEWSAAIRYTLAALLCLALKPSALSKDQLRATLGGMKVGFWYCIGFLLQSYGLQTVSAGNRFFYTALSVVIVAILDVASRRRKASRRQTTSIVMVLIGVAILELGGMGSASSSSFLPSLSFLGDAASFGQAICFGTGYWVLEPLSQEFAHQSGSVTIGQLLSVAMGTLLFAIKTCTIPTAEVAISWALDPLVVGGVFWLSIGPTALTLYMETIALQILPALDAAMIMTSVSIWGTLWVYIFLGDVPSTLGAVGGVLILIACLLTSLKEDKDYGEITSEETDNEDNV